jgi:glycine dehydrogenase
MCRWAITPFPSSRPTAEIFGALLQYPDTEGTIHDYRAFCEKVHAVDALVVVATDLLALTLLTPPGEWGADIAVGSPNASACRWATAVLTPRSWPPRTSSSVLCRGAWSACLHDAEGNPALRLSLQTREQHIRREKATSQHLHGPGAAGGDGLHVRRLSWTRMGWRALPVASQLMTAILAGEAERMGYTVNAGPIFDTLKIADGPTAQAELIEEALSREVNPARLSGWRSGVSLDEATTLDDLRRCWRSSPARMATLICRSPALWSWLSRPGLRARVFLTHPVFNRYHTETEMLRYITKLRGPGSLAGTRHDPARLLYDETQRHRRDDPDHLARI